ncbi:hypothetical protein QBC47DRAFT_414756 [Echria macrotheca]|uniref:Glutamyl-tRNA synthetase n=1 Tax=Echria macrotheca TaxID=438768 RepID=A0AAJ0BAR3_9PEZI|nr:hypothetical protein QBC47DRAFT_414756 [Echria macrotheca]
MDTPTTTTTTLPALPENYTTALSLIDAAHAQDPRPSSSDDKVPFELDYARKMSRWLAVRCPDASPALQLACRAQHFRRWEIPRSTYPPTRGGYLTWRARLKARAAEEVGSLLEGINPPLGRDVIDKVARLIRKEGLGKGGEEDEGREVQVLEDVACLVFLDDQFEDFERREDVDEDKIVGILRKTWGKMSVQGRALALRLELSERAGALVKRALEEGDAA